MDGQQGPYGIEEFDGTDAEMAHRLLRLKRNPSPGLVARVHAIPTLSQRRAWHMPRWAWSAVAVVALLTALVAASPPLRAAIGTLQETIGNVYLTIADRSPDTSDATIVEPTLLSLEDARTAVPFAFGVPSHVPDGWTMVEPVWVIDLGGGPFVEILWTNPDTAETTILFTARPAPQDDGLSGSWLVGPDSFREIEIGGQPAAIVRGGWDHDSREWAWLDRVTLIWTVDDVEYSLSTHDSKGSEARLIAMAESIR